MHPAARRVPSPPPQHPNMMNVSWQDFLKETKEVSWQEALLETHFEAQRAPNKPNLVRVRLRAVIYTSECIQQLRTPVVLLTRAVVMARFLASDLRYLHDAELFSITA